MILELLAAKFYYADVPVFTISADTMTLPVIFLFAFRPTAFLFCVLLWPRDSACASLVKIYWNCRRKCAFL